MTRLIRFIALLLVAAAPSGVAFAETAEEAWNKLVGVKLDGNPMFAFVKNDPGLPNVLIHGDSISMGYTQEVRKRLKGKANVYRMYRNCGSSTLFIPLMTTMHETMRDEKKEGHWTFKWDVIHFNSGLHDLKYIQQGTPDSKERKRAVPTEQYQKNMRDMIAYIQKTDPGAKIIFATTTPIPESSMHREVGDSVEYNKAALKVLEEFPAVAVNDLHSYVKPNHSKWWSHPGNVHFNPAGQKALGEQVARVILKELKNREKTDKEDSK